MYIYDTETIGFYGVPVIIQYARDDGPIHIHNVWESEAEETMDLIQAMMDEGVCGYNLTFDHFHIQKMYNMLELVSPSLRPIDSIHEMYEAEAVASYGKCLKPYEIIDLMIHVRKMPFQQSMGRPEWRINKVHVSLVYPLLEYLNNHTRLESYMHTTDDAIWHSQLILNKKKEWVDRDFRDIVGRIKPSGGLKPICAYIFNEPVTKYPDVMPSISPVELGYIPIAKRIVEMDGWPTQTPPEGLKKDYRGTWPLYVKYYNSHWKQEKHRKYAEDDVYLTRKLYQWMGEPDQLVDDALTATVASAKWRGFDLDLQMLEHLRESIIEEINPQIISASKAQQYLLDAMDNFEKAKFFDEEGKIQGKTGAPALEIIGQWTEICDTCLEKGLDGCPDCPPSQAAIRAGEIKKSRQLNSRVKTINKLILSERLHPGFKVIGTKTSRMSGSDGLNPQGIDRSESIRECFTLGANLTGGDFDGFELTICDAVYKDPKLREMLQTDQKVHAAFGANLYDKTYDEIKANPKLYTRSKSGLFLLLYGGTWGGIEYKLEVPARLAQKAEQEFFRNHPKILERREQIYEKYRPLKDDFSWEEPLPYIESFMKHRRYFTLEWKICKMLYDLARNVPFERKDEITVIRRKKVQTVSNALRSAIYQTITNIQKKVSRAAINQEIQSPGADITKLVQYSIDEIQPKGIHPWVVQTMNIHDEIVAVVHDKTFLPVVGNTVYECIDRLREKVPLLEMKWNSGKNWKDIHG